MKLYPPAGIIFILLAVFSAKVFANPKGGQLRAGSASFEEGTGALTIRQSSDRGIIHWQDFSIGRGEITRFVQPGSKSATLNRVIGGVSSSIHGALEANGQVYLINPNGILVGPTGRINTAGFVASTLDVPDAEFLAGSNMNFSGSSMAGVVNLGTITAADGDVILMARTVENAGTISAPNGVAALAAGNDILLQAAGDERVVVKSALPGGGNGVNNSGTIAAAQAELKAAGGNVYALAVNNTGVVRASGITQKNGRVILSAAGGEVRNSGTISAKNIDGHGGRVLMSGGKGGKTINTGIIDAAASEATKSGGTVEILGDDITLGSGSVINASGADGGIVAIGLTAEKASQTTETGGVATLAQDPAAEAAKRASIDANSTILANATSIGKGGRIVVWSDEGTTVGGILEARGGELGGDGGLIETSAAKGLVVAPEVKINAAAPQGKGGTWLIDPIYNVFIVAGAGLVNNGGAPGFVPNDDDSFIGADLIANQLNNGTNVVIATTSAVGPAVGTGTQNGDIFVNADIIKITGSAATLQLTADGKVDIQADIFGAPPSNLSLTISAGGDVTLSGGTTLGMDDLSITTNNGGSVLLNGKVLTNTLTVNITAFPVAFPGTVQIDNALNQIGTINQILSSQGIELFDSAGGLIINGIVSGGGFNPGDHFNTVLQTVGDFTINAGGVIFSNQAGDIFIAAHGGYFINNSAPTSLNATSPGGAWSVYSESDATLAQGGNFNDGGIIAAQAPGLVHGPWVFNTADITTDTFFFTQAAGVLPTPPTPPAPAPNRNTSRITTGGTGGPENALGHSGLSNPVTAEQRARLQAEYNPVIVEVSNTPAPKIVPKPEPQINVVQKIINYLNGPNFSPERDLKSGLDKDVFMSTLKDLARGMPEELLMMPEMEGILWNWALGVSRVGVTEKEILGHKAYKASLEAQIEQRRSALSDKIRDLATDLKLSIPNASDPFAVLAKQRPAFEEAASSLLK